MGKRKIYVANLSRWPIEVSSHDGYDTEEEAKESFMNYWKNMEKEHPERFKREE